MAKKLEGNGIFESSRMILPEHREAYLKQQQEQNKRTKPILDDQEWELIEQALAESLKERTEVTLKLFDEYEDVLISGVVTSMDTLTRRIKLATAEDDWEWIKIEDVLSATIN